MVAAGDPRIAAVVSQVPFPGVEFGRASERSARATLQLLAAAASDTVRGWLRRSPRLVPVFGDPGEIAVFANPHDKAIIDKLAAQAPEWRNAVAARMLFPLMRYQPRTAASLVAMPLLVCIADKETAASPALTADLVSRAPKAAVQRYPIGHFDAYSGEWLDKIVSDQVSFLHAHLAARTTPLPGIATQQAAVGSREPRRGSRGTPQAGDSEVSGECGTGGPGRVDGEAVRGRWARLVSVESQTRRPATSRLWYL